MKRILGSVAVMVALVLATNARAQNLHNGTSTTINQYDVFIYRVGTTSDTVLTNTGSTVWLDEYTPVGISNGVANYGSDTPIYQSIEMPTNWYGGEAPLVAEASATEEGLLTVSADGRFLVIPGFAMSPGQVATNAQLYYAGFPGSGLTTNDVAPDGADTTNAVTLGDIPRVVALLDGLGHLYMSTVITGVSMQGDDLRSAASTDGTNIWLGGSEHNVSYTQRGSLLPLLQPGQGGTLGALVYGVSTDVCPNSSVTAPTRAVGIYGLPNSFSGVTSNFPVLYVDRNQNIFGATNSNYVAYLPTSINCTTNTATCTNITTYVTNYTAGCSGTRGTGCTTNYPPLGSNGCAISSILTNVTLASNCTNLTGCTTNFAYVPLNPFGGALPVYSSLTNWVELPGDMVGGGKNELISANGFVMFNLANQGPWPGAPDTIYIADQEAVGFAGEPAPHGGGILKYCWVNQGGTGVWQTVGSPSLIGGIGAEDAYAVTGYEVNPTNVVLYATSATNNLLYSFVDYTGYQGNPQNNSYGNNGDPGFAFVSVLWNTGEKTVKTMGIAMAPVGGDSGTISSVGTVESVGPPYGPYFRGPQGGPFQPTNGYNYSLANLGNAGEVGQLAVGNGAGADTNLFVGYVNGASTNDQCQPCSFGTIISGGSVTVNVTPNSSVANALSGGQSYTATVTWKLGPHLSVEQIGTIKVDSLSISPTTNFISTGPLYGPFSPASTTYTLTNLTGTAQQWVAFTTNTWDSFSQSQAQNQPGGTLPPNGSTNLTLYIVPSVADALLYQGSYSDYLVVSNLLLNGSSSALPVQPEITLQVGFGFFDNFGDALAFSNGNVVGQENWRGGAIPPDINPVQIITNGPNNVQVYSVPGGCVNDLGTSQQPYKYVSSGPLTNAYSAICTNVVGGVTNIVPCDPVPTYAVTGVLITFTNAPGNPNYIFEQGTTFLAWNDAGILSAGGNSYVWTTELNQYETGGGPHGANTFTLGNEYAVFLVSDFVNSNAWVFSFTGPNETGATNDLPTLLSQVPCNTGACNGHSGESGPSWFAVWSDGLTDCSYCPGESPQGWESTTIGQYSSCPTEPQPGYFCYRAAASTNFSDVYDFIMGGFGTPPVANFTNNPVSGTAPLSVSFTDTSSGQPTSWQWSSGDCTYSTLQDPTFIYTNAGTYYASLIANNAGGPSANIATQIIVVSAPITGMSYQNWSSYYFPGGGTLSGPNVDVYGTGMSNTNKFLAGFSGTNAAAYLHIISTTKSNVSGTASTFVSYLGASGDTNYAGGPSVRTNVLEYTTGTVNGSYSNLNWMETGQTNILGIGQPAPSGGTGLGTVTNMTDVGGATNNPSRFYRIRVLLP